MKQKVCTWGQVCLSVCLSGAISLDSHFSPALDACSASSIQIPTIWTLKPNPSRFLAYLRGCLLAVPGEGAVQVIFSREQTGNLCPGR